MAEKPKLAIYWASSCGGCEISVVNLHEKIIDVDAAFDLMFCPCIMDTKKQDIEQLEDKSIMITLFNGAIRTEENEEMACLLRKKSKIMIAFGACSYEGGIPALANFTSKKEIFDRVYLNNQSTVNPENIIPKSKFNVKEGEITIPEFFNRVKTLAQTVDVDYFIPGCPPESKQIWNVIELVLSGSPLPDKGSIIGAGVSTVCEECLRTKEDKKIEKLYRTYEIIPDEEKCLLEQGLFCMGIATRSGCGALCPSVNMPCTGCYGSQNESSDQGSKMASALGSIIDIEKLKNIKGTELNKKVDSIIEDLPDFAGCSYKYSLANSILKGRVE